MQPTRRDDKIQHANGESLLQRVALQRVAAQEKPIAEELSHGSDAPNRANANADTDEFANANADTDEFANANADDPHLDESDLAFTQPTTLRHVCSLTAAKYLSVLRLPR